MRNELDDLIVETTTLRDALSAELGDVKVNQFYLLREIKYFLDTLGKKAGAGQYDWPKLKSASDYLIDLLNTKRPDHVFCSLEDAKNNAERYSLLFSNVREIVSKIVESAKKDLESQQKIFSNQSLENWLESNGFSSSEAKEIVKKMVERGYGQKELSNMAEPLLFDGRLFLNSLFRICVAQNIERADVKLGPLSKALDIIEFVSSTPAHFIWVGPPTYNKSELLGVRSLKKAKPEQKIRFWVLDEHVQTYQNIMQNELKLSNIDVVSIENYAQKIHIPLDNKITKIQIDIDRDCPRTLLSEIERFKALSKQKVEASKKEKPGSIEQKLKMTDAIRDRVTIVDHVKPTIPLFQGGWVFDVDLIFPQLSDSSASNEPLPAMGRWAFPLMGWEWFGDVWFFYCNKSFTWLGAEEALSREQCDSCANCKLSESVVINVRSHQIHHLPKYNRLARELYESRGEADITEEFCGDLGGGICQIANDNKSSPERIDFHDFITHNWVARSDRPADKQVSLYRMNGQSGIAWVKSAEENISYTLPMVKYYGQSYIPGKNDKLDQVKRSINAGLFYLPEDKFETVLAQRCEFTNLKVTDLFSVEISKLTDPKKTVKLIDITMLHLALLVRPELFFTVLNKVPSNEMADVLAMKVQIPAALFASDSAQAMQGDEEHTLFSLVKKLRSNKAYGFLTSTSGQTGLNVFTSGCKAGESDNYGDLLGKIEKRMQLELSRLGDQEIVAKILEKAQIVFRGEFFKAENVTLEQIIDWAKVPASSRELLLNAQLGEKIRKALVEGLGLDPKDVLPESVNIETVREKVLGYIKQEKRGPSL